MSSNLTAESKAKYAEYLQAKNLDDRIRLLEEFLSLVPKHKATERIVALNRTRLAKLKAEREAIIQRQKQLASATEDPFAIKREPQTIQVIMVSDFFGNDVGAGKTTLLKNLTGVKDGKPGIYTAEPLVGIYEWEKVKFQLIEEPALHKFQYLPRILTLIRGTDILALIIDLTRDPIMQVNHIVELLKENHIYLNRKPPAVKIEKTGSGGVQLFFLTKSAKRSEYLSDFINDMVDVLGVKNATVKIYEEITVEELEMAFNRASAYVPAIIIATKADAPNTKYNYEKLVKRYGVSENTDKVGESDSPASDSEGSASENKSVPHEKKKSYDPHFEIFPVAIKYDKDGKEVRLGLDNLGEVILKKLDMIRIFTKSKRGVADRPLVMKKGSTVGDVAKKIHKDLYKTFKYAIIYRQKGPQKKIRAGLEFPVENFDVIEIFSRV